MKLKPHHINRLEVARDAYLYRHGERLDIAKVRQAALDVAASDARTKDVPMRARWDLARYSGALTGGFLAEVYAYANDNHLNTAIKHVWGV